MDTISAKSMYLRTPKARFLVLLLALLFWICSMPAMQITNAAAISNAGSSLASMYDSLSASILGRSGSSSAANNGAAKTYSLIHLEKTTNGGDGLKFSVGTALTWSYAVTNWTYGKITNVVVTDDKEGAIGTIPEIAAGATVTLTKTGVAKEGDYKNTGTAAFTPSYPGAMSISDKDDSCYFGYNAAMTLTKTTQGPIGAAGDGVLIMNGAPVTWIYVVKNTGNVDLKHIKITDDKITGQIGTEIDTLHPGESATRTKTGTAVIGDYSNTGTATGKTSKDYGEIVVTAADASSYFGAEPKIAIDKLTNGTDGSLIPVGSDLIWTYKVTNIGNIPLTDIKVTDNVLGDIGTIASLAPGAHETLTAPVGTAQLGYHDNIGTAVGTYSLTASTIAEATYKPPTPPPQPQPLTVTASDHSSYTGVNVGISIDKTTNGIDGPVLLAGDAITWSYIVTNTGDYELFDITVEDSEEGAVGTIDTLAPGASETLTLEGTAVSGYYDNTGTATGSYTLEAVLNDMAVTGPIEITDPYPTVSSSDFSYYNCYGPAITIDKTTNGYDGLSITVGSAITWSYLVTNTGDMELTNIVVTDSKEGPVGTIDHLDVDESETLTMTGTATSGLYENTGTATGEYVIEEAVPASIAVIEPTGTPEPTVTTVSDSDDSSYTGTIPYYPPSYSYALTINKTTNGGDGLTIAAGAAVTWSYVVTNTGNTILSNIIVTDSDPAIGTVGSILTLNPGASSTLTRTGTAISGTYANTGTATCQSDGGLLTASDASSYIGSAADIGLAKTVQNVTAAGPIGATATGVVGDDFLFTLVVANTGTLALSNVVITDNTAVVGSNVTVGGILQQWAAGTGGIATITIPSLASGQVVSITYAYNTAATDLPITVTNIASATGTSGTATAAATGTATLSTTSVLGAVRVATPTTTSVLGAARTGETSNAAEIIIALTLLLAAGGLLTFIEIRKQRRDGTGR